MEIYGQFMVICVQKSTHPEAFQVTKVHKSVGIGKVPTDIAFFSSIFTGLKKNYHYSEKTFSLKRKNKIYISISAIQNSEFINHNSYRS